MLLLFGVVLPVSEATVAQGERDGEGSGPGGVPHCPVPSRPCHPMGLAGDTLALAALLAGGQRWHLGVGGEGCPQQPCSCWEPFLERGI